MKTRQPDNTISLSLLDHLTRTGSNRAALGSQALFYLQGKGVTQDLKKGRMRLLIAARAYDRISAARIAIYYHEGKYGFGKDEHKSIFWRDRVTDWLRSDAALIYNVSELKRSAVQRYETWISVCVDLWGISVVEGDLPEKQSRA